MNIPFAGTAVKPFDGFNTPYGGVVVAGRRRGRGEGTIYRRKDGRWVGQYDVGGKRRYVYGKSRGEVAAQSVKAVADGNEGSSLKASLLEAAPIGWQLFVLGGVRAIKQPSCCSLTHDLPAYWGKLL